MKLDEALKAVASGATLQRSEAREVFSATLGGEADPVQLAGLLMALSQRGETSHELLGAVDALRGAMEPFEHDSPDAIDTCGTGGDGLEMFNVSTAAAIVACAAGATVIKHGNRSVSSRCGSADLLEAAGVALELSASGAREVLDATGMTFLFAPSFHPAMRHAAPVRRALGVRTLFNWLGPLCNPGGVRRQLLGVHAPQLVSMFAEVLEELGAVRALVVCGAGSADELTLAGTGTVEVVGFEHAPRFGAAACGLEEAPLEALRGGDASHNLKLLHQVLAAEGGPLLDAVALNAGAALFVAGRADSAPECVALALEAIESGRAGKKLEQLVQASQRAAGARS